MTFMFGLDRVLGPAYNLPIGSTSQQGATLTDSRSFAVRLVANQDCYLAIGTNPVATATSTRLVANQVEYFAVGLGEKIATLRTGLIDGTLNVTEII